VGSEMCIRDSIVGDLFAEAHNKIPRGRGYLFRDTARARKTVQSHQSESRSNDWGWIDGGSGIVATLSIA
jgi:hypothetical protein